MYTNNERIYNAKKSVHRKLDFSDIAVAKEQVGEFQGGYFVSPSMESSKYIKRQNYSSSNNLKRNTSPKKTVSFAETTTKNPAYLETSDSFTKPYFSGGAYANSPDPSTVPIPTFERKLSSSPPRSPISDAASMHLRRLLNIPVVA